MPSRTSQLLRPIAADLAEVHRYKGGLVNISKEEQELELLTNNCGARFAEGIASGFSGK